MSEIGSGNGSSFDSAVDTNTTLEVDSSTMARAAIPNDVNSGIIAVQTKLGTNPKGSKTTVEAVLQTEHNTDGTHKSWRRLYSNTLTSATSNIIISGLDGNTDILYWIFARIVGGAGTTINLYLNYDSAANYGYQYFEGYDTFIDAGRDTASTGLYIGGVALNTISMFKGLLYAKSGYVRTLNGEVMMSVTTETKIDTVSKIDSVWSNTTDNITSLVVHSNVPNGLGIGTFVELWRWKP